MYKFMSKKMRENKKGFTLVELIVVIAILAILAAIAVPRLLGFQDRAEQQADKQSAVQVRNALALLYANNEIDVDDSTDGNNSTGNVVIIADVTSGGNIGVNGYLKSMSSSSVGELIYDLTGSFDLKGDRIEVEIDEEGEVEVKQP